MKRTDTDVCVIGGGPAGLAAAIAARRQGFRVVVADIQRPPIDKACGEGLMPDSLAELARLGVSLDGTPQGSFRGIRFVGPQNSVQAEFPRGRGIGIRRTVLHATLIDAAERIGIEMHWGVRVGGMRPGAVRVDGDAIGCKWIIGADGQNSQVRQRAGLNPGKLFERRFALRQHFTTPDPPEFVEIYWGEDSQAYITPMAPNEVCVALIARRKLTSFATELRNLPHLRERLRGARPSSAVRGAVTLSNRLRSVHSDHVALIGEASGSVDAITGQGLALAFRQALSLGRALAADDLSIYGSMHRQLDSLPQFMRRTMLLMDKSSFVRRRVLRALDSRPPLFERMLAVHVGELPLSRFGAASVADLGWHMLATQAS
ncbi:MAG: NAD(P)/FAD-dependent oxidoreductase [Acidobacteria bacterium]|nr:NAD(P)/FAD-dependent oxidoreductase [Acidobacteriota bacterium]